MNATDIGRFGEAVAAKFLKKHGYKILERNRHQSHNEIDLIASNKEFLLFVEVKTRSVREQTLYLPYGTPAEAVDRKKQLRLLQAARDYLTVTKLKGRQPRMDVIEVYLDQRDGHVLKVNHIADAFGA